MPYDALVHLAGKAHDLKKTANDADYYDANFELTKRLYDQFLNLMPKKPTPFVSYKGNLYLYKKLRRFL